MPVSTLSAAVHITPVVLKTFLRHGKRLAIKRNEKRPDEAQDDIFFDEQAVSVSCGSHFLISAQSLSYCQIIHRIGNSEYRRVFAGIVSRPLLSDQSLT